MFEEGRLSERFCQQTFDGVFCKHLQYQIQTSVLSFSLLNFSCSIISSLAAFYHPIFTFSASLRSLSSSFQISRALGCILITFLRLVNATQGPIIT